MSEDVPVPSVTRGTGLGAPRHVQRPTRLIKVPAAVASRFRNGSATRDCISPSAVSEGLLLRGSLRFASQTRYDD